jgi:hypothetical protein
MAKAAPRGFPSLESYLESAAAAPRGSVFGEEHDEADARLRYLLELYVGASAEHSFVDASGQIFDCIPAEKQPALLKSGRPLAHPPRLSERARARTANRPLMNPEATDRFGNATRCPLGTVPIRRITLEELGRFPSLDAFLRKAPRSRRALRSQLLALHATQHEYAHAYAGVENIGGHGVFTIWKPPVAAPAIFSLSQQWYIATGANGLQTVECGWQVYPDKYGHPDPVLFTYWTADGYCKTGSYNTDANHFVQYASDCPVGMSLGAGSTRDGEQVEIELTVFLADGNWWLFVNGTAPENAVGYYPIDLYERGPLATAAAEIDFGGETCSDGGFPPMGSGAFASEGIGKAAYQRNISYFLPDGSEQEAALTASEEWPGSYTIVMGHDETAGEFFYFGGPGDPMPG